MFLSDFLRDFCDLCQMVFFTKLLFSTFCQVRYLLQHVTANAADDIKQGKKFKRHLKQLTWQTRGERSSEFRNTIEENYGSGPELFEKFTFCTWKIGD